jgi:hypothetical protein
LSLVGLVFFSAAAASAQDPFGDAPVPAPRAIRALGGAIPAAPAAAPADANSEAKPEGAAEEAVEAPRTIPTDLGPREIRLHLIDGSVISGDLSVSEIEVDTPFGKLIVPIDRIRRFQPGLDSYPELSQQIATLIQNLGADDYKTREQAHKDLVAMGPQVRPELERHNDDDNAEIKRHVGEILKQFDEMAEELGDDEESPAQPWIRLDTVVTTDFTVVGKVSPAQFQIASKYGPLTIKLADVRQGERQTDVKESLRKTVTVDGTNLVQRSFRNTGIRVQAGDKIVLQAEGNLVMTPWGSNAASGPDGAPNYGWYIANQIPGGALVARVGEKGTIFKVGRQSTFTAKNSGVLQLAIGMQAQYANQNYSFPGEYRVKLRVDPKQ